MKQAPECPGSPHPLILSTQVPKSVVQQMDAAASSLPLETV